MNIYEAIFNEPNLAEVSEVDIYKMFNEYKSNNTIQSDFDSNTWRVYDEVRIYNMCFEPEEYPYEELLSKKDFVKYLKFFFILNYSDLAFLTIQGTIRLIMNLLKDPKNRHSMTTTNGYQASTFFHSLPVELPLVEDLDDDIENLKFDGDKKRVLSEIRSYFIFDMIIKDFWKNEADNTKKLFFFPIWFWWEITAVMPTRPTEILLTQRDCLNKKKDQYFIALKKSGIKGRGKKVSHIIKNDYMEASFPIPERIGKEIEWYINQTKNYPETELKTLLIPDVHYEILGANKNYRNRYYTYNNLRTCLFMYYEQIIVQKYGYEVVDNDTLIQMGKNQIGTIQLGDTRHIALIDLALEGGSPWVMMTLAGHNNIQMAAHYYSNVEKVIECKTYSQFVKRNSNKQIFTVSDYKTPIFGRRGKKIDGGYCFSEKYALGSFDDCIKVLTNNGEIGNCKNCPLFRKDSITFEASKKIYTDRIDNSTEIMLYLLKRARSEKGLEDEVNKAQMKLVNEYLSYQQYLTETKEFNFDEKEDN